MQGKNSKSAPKFRAALTARLTHILRSEDGNLFVVFVPLLFIMAIWGGIAVDLMRFESRRAALQGVTDRAVLAAANLDQKLDPKAVVFDYFTKAEWPINGKALTSSRVSSVVT